MKQNKSSHYDRNDTKEADIFDKMYSDTIEIDLHNYSTGDALAYFINCYNDCLGVKTIKVIHGYGSTGAGGEILIRLRSYLKDHANYLSFEIGENIDHNRGYTIVHPSKHLPSISRSIEEKILEFCAVGKSEEKIFKKFRLYSDIEVKKAIQSLQKQRKIRPFDKGKLKHYKAVNP